MRLVPTFVRSLVVLLSACAAITAAHADPNRLAQRLGDQQLQRLFWDCDAHSLTQALSLPDGQLCASVHDEAKRRLFAGDWQRLLAWWRDNKGVQRALRGAAETPAVSVATE